MDSIQRPRIGTIIGTHDGETISFRGLKYASLEHGFAEPQLFSPRPGVPVDATRHGPTTISPPSGCDMELSLIQKHLPHEDFQSSATECLNLNICTPGKISSPLPVFVFLHGGGFAIGANSWPQYDLRRIVGVSQELGKPVIGVQINYRLGVFGFLDSEKLRQAGLKPNRGIRDQRLAFDWLKENIAGFGGDPTRLTVIGESAGGTSSTLHLQSTKPLFQQLVAMGGTSLLMKPLPPQVAEFAHSTVVKILGMDENLSAVEHLEALLKIPPKTFLAKVGPEVSLMPVIDGEIITGAVSFEQWRSSDRSTAAAGTAWCHRVMLGDCQFDGSIFKFMLAARQQGIVSAFQEAMIRHLSTTETELQAIYEGYNIKDALTAEEATKNILRMFTDVQFYAPTFTMAQAWPQNGYVYHFNEPNPWEGPNKGEVNHILDIAFLFQNFNEYLSGDQVKSAKAFARDFITFVNGEEPYSPVEARTGGAQVYGPPHGSGSHYVKSRIPEDYGRRALVWKLAEQFGWDKLSVALDMFLAGH